MAADEIFVLMLVVVCVVGLTLMEIRSRRRNRLRAQTEAALVSEVPDEPVTAPDVPASAQSDRRRRRRDR